MDSERWEQVDNLLQSVLRRAAVERDAFLRQACAGDEALEREVRSLLASHRDAGSFIESPAIEVAARAIASNVNVKVPGTRLGPYEILAAIGAGGMGEVYRARDTGWGANRH